VIPEGGGGAFTDGQRRGSGGGSESSARVLKFILEEGEVTGVGTGRMEGGRKGGPVVVGGVEPWPVSVPTSAAV